MDESVQPIRVAALPLTLFVFTAAVEIGAVALSWGLEPWTDTAIYGVFSPAMVAAGMLVASRHPRNPIGWLLLWLGASNAVFSDLSQGYGLRAHLLGWPAGTAGEWVSNSSVVTQMAPTFLLWLLFPTGRLLSRAWGTVVTVGGVASLVAIGAHSFSHLSDSSFVGDTNPYVVDWLPTQAMWVVGWVVLAAAQLASVAALVVRFRRSTGVERQQLKFFTFATAFAVVVLPLGPLLWDRYPVMRALVALVLFLQPVAICVAMFRYRLYDIDRVISRTISYGVVTAVVLGVYGVTVITIGALAGRSSAWGTAGATLAAVTAFHPVRRRAQSLVDRRFDRARFEAVARIEQFIDDLRVGRAAPEQIENVLREVTGDTQLSVRYRPPGDAPGPISGIPVRRGDALIATITGHPTLTQRRSLVSEAVDSAGLAIEIAGLRVELRRQLDEVEASRARLVTVADEERRRLERDLHDGAQQRLVSIGLALRHAQHQLRGNGDVSDASRTLDGAVAEITLTIDELRELAHGLRPSSLDAGLGPALRELAQRVPLPVTVDTTAERFTSDAETTAYFVACEALTNVVKHARASHVAVRANQHNGALTVAVTDDGIGGATPQGGSGLRGLTDRLAALGGTLTIDSDRTGTTIIASIPCAS